MIFLVSSYERDVPPMFRVQHLKGGKVYRIHRLKRPVRHKRTDK